MTISLNPKVTLSLDVKLQNTKTLSSIFALLEHPEYAKDNSLILDALEGIITLLGNLSEGIENNCVTNKERDLIVLANKWKRQRKFEENYSIFLETLKLYPTITTVREGNTDCIECINPENKKVCIYLMSDSALDMMKKLDSIKK